MATPRKKRSTKRTTGLNEALSFVTPALRESEIVPVLGALRIHAGRVSSYNGEMKLSAPIPTKLEGTPSGSLIAKALKALPSIDTLEESKRRDNAWALKGGKSEITVPVIEEDKNFDDVEPEGEIIELKKSTREELPNACASLLPFISTDETRAFAQSLKFEEGTATATNGATLIEYWLDFPNFALPILVPVATIKLLAKLPPPSHVQVSNSSATFHWRKEDKYLLTFLIKAAWPDIKRVFTSANYNVGENYALTPDFWEQLKTILHFAEDDSVTWCKNQLKTASAVSTVDVVLDGELTFSGKRMLDLKSLVGEEGSIWPEDIIGFKGKLFRGALMSRHPGFQPSA